MLHLKYDTVRHLRENQKQIEALALLSPRNANNTFPGIMLLTASREKKSTAETSSEDTLIKTE